MPSSGRWTFASEDAVMKSIRSRILLLILPPMIGFFVILASIIYFNRQEEQLIIITLGIASLVWILGSAWIISYKISEPVQKLKDAALHLAAGDYDEPINVEGPQEIVELASTLNTMRECLLENIERLTDYPLSREKLYGEYECAELLQFEMFDHALESVPKTDLFIKKISLPSSPLYGLRFKWAGGILSLEEAEEEGFRGIYKLLSEGSPKKIFVDLNKATFKSNALPDPLFWSAKESKLTVLKKLEKGDILILFNTGLTRQMPHPQILKDWFSKILKHFAKDGLELTSAMVESELKFFAKKHILHEDIHILLITLDGHCVVR